jgi:hypothetical protein
VARGFADRAPSMLLEALSNCEDIGSKVLGAYAMLIASGLAAFREESRRAAELHAAASRQLEAIGFRCEPADEAFLAPLLAQTRDALGTVDFAAAQSAGRTLSYEEAAATTRTWLEQISNGSVAAYVPPVPPTVNPSILSVG